MMSLFALPRLSTENLRGDIMGGITAGVVALPLALALGVASGAGPIAGLYGAMMLGFVAAFLGGTGAQISGPTGPMVVVFAGLFAGLGGDISMIFTAAILAGLLQIAFGLMGIGQYIRLVPYPVISGFMSGIGCIIIILQLGRLVGHEVPGDPVAALQGLPTYLSDINVLSLVIGAVTLATVFLWPARVGKYLPAPLAALAIGTILSLFLPIAEGLRLGDVPTGLPDALLLPDFTALASDYGVVIIKAAVILALLGSIDSLLTSLVADNMTRTRHESNRELLGQGIGNTLAGMIGGIPGAGATMRTVVNIRAGGKTPLSGMTHGILLLLIILGLGDLASVIPHAALAGILVKVGYDIIDWTYLKKAHKGPRWDLVLMAVVLGLTVFVDLITAVGVGVFLAALAFVKQVADTQLNNLGKRPERVENDEEHALFEKVGDKLSVFEFNGPLSFGAIAELGHMVREKSDGKAHAILLDFATVPFMDVSAANAVETIIEDANAAKRKVFIAGMSDKVKEVLEGLSVLTAVERGALFDTRLTALKAAEAYINGGSVLFSDDQDPPSSRKAPAKEKNVLSERVKARKPRGSGGMPQPAE